MAMYLVDTDVISEARKGDKGNPGVRQFFEDADSNGDALYLCSIWVHLLPS
jgi:toxin FitB